MCADVEGAVGVTITYTVDCNDRAVDTEQLDAVIPREQSVRCAAQVECVDIRVAKPKRIDVDLPTPSGILQGGEIRQRAVPVYADMVN